MGAGECKVEDSVYGVVANVLASCDAGVSVVNCRRMRAGKYWVAILAWASVFRSRRDLVLVRVGAKASL